MKIKSKLKTKYSNKNQLGIILIISLLFIIILTLLGVSMFRGYGLLQKISGNTSEKTRAFEAAESSLQYGEWWVTQGGAGTGTTCSTANTITSSSNMRTCSNALSSISTPFPWVTASSYTPPEMSVSAGGGTTTIANSNGNKIDVQYSRAPDMYIYYMGLSSDNKKMLYQINSAGYGGSTNSAAVVQSVFSSASKSTPVDGL